MNYRLALAVLVVAMSSFVCAQETRLQEHAITNANLNLKRTLVCRVMPGEKITNPHRLSDAQVVAATHYLSNMEEFEAFFDEVEEPSDDTETGSYTIPIACNTLPSYNCELTKHSKCREITLPPACATTANCFTSKTDCTKGADNCGEITLPSACPGGITSVTDCTKSAAKCDVFTLPPACSTSETYCFTKSSSVNCGTKGAICNKMTMHGEGCTSNPDLCNLTFNAAGSCAETKNWNCVNTLKQCDTKTENNCTKGYACEKTVAIVCLTFKGILCPDGPPYPTAPEEPSSGLLIMGIGLPLLGVVAFRGKDVLPC
ncbi:MAG: hypothetical protein KF784_00325 [Fimbriimonadaceae bacterium]|nr:hypothetical protein [Fimbriimonadaceae bacterium]